MAPKKDAKKGEEERNFFMENYFMEKKKEVLEYRLMMKDEAIAGSRSAEEALQKRIAELDRGFKDEHDKSLEVTGEMSRQYREMQDSFNERIEVLQGEVSDSKQEIESVQREIEKTRIEKDEVIRKKDEEIRALTLKMETMAFEFADMLKETLDKMSQRIEVTHSSWDRDAGKPPLMNRLKEFSLADEPPAPQRE